MELSSSELDLEGRPPGDACATAIGWVAVEAAWLEVGMSLLYAALVGSAMGGLLASGLTYYALADGCEQMAASLSASHPNRQRIRDFIKETRGLMERRNHVVHGVWVGSPASTLTFRRWGKDIETNWTESSLRSLAADLRDAERAVHRLLVDMGAI
jgi:hypothetical protein